MKTECTKLTNPEIIIQEGDEVLYVGSAITRRVREWKPVEENIIGATVGAYTSHIFRRPVPVDDQSDTSKSGLANPVLYAISCILDIKPTPDQVANDIFRDLPWTSGGRTYNHLLKTKLPPFNFRGSMPDHQEIDRQMAWAHEPESIREFNKKMRDELKSAKSLAKAQDVMQLIENNLLCEIKIPTHFTGLCNMDHCNGIKLTMTGIPMAGWRNFKSKIPKGTTHVATDPSGDKIYVSVDGGSFLHWLENKQIWAQPYGEFPYTLKPIDGG